MTIATSGAWLMEHWIVSTILGVFLFLFALGLIIQLIESYGMYVWYFGILLALFILAMSQGKLTYFVAFALGVATAFAEIISKFADEPLKALKTVHALFYHLLNGLIAVFALWLLLINGAANDSTLDQVKNVMAAGLGSMLIMRSKLFNIKTDGEDVSFGPDQIIKIYFRFMQSAIDRVRAIDRIKFVKEELENKAYEPARAYSLTMLHAAQALDENKGREVFDKAVYDIDNQQKLDEQLKSYQLGFALLNAMGEEFVKTLFEKWKPQWQLQAPMPQQAPSLLSRLNPFASKEEEVPYLAYGSSMSTTRFVQRLNWTGIDEATLTALLKSVPCVLPEYRIAFNKPDQEGAGATGLPNLVPAPGSRVEAVLYLLPKNVIEFLDKTEAGYVRKKVTVFMKDGKPAEVETYVAEQTTEGLPPNQEFLKLAIAGAEEHKLNADYVKSLRSLESAPH